MGKLFLGAVLLIPSLCIACPLFTAKNLSCVDFKNVIGYKIQELSITRNADKHHLLIIEDDEQETVVLPSIETDEELGTLSIFCASDSLVTTFVGSGISTKNVLTVSEGGNIKTKGTDFYLDEDSNGKLKLQSREISRYCTPKTIERFN